MCKEAVHERLPEELEVRMPRERMPAGCDALWQTSISMQARRGHAWVDPGPARPTRLQLYARSIQLRHWLHPCPRQHYLTRSQSCPPYVVRLALRQRAH